VAGDRGERTALERMLGARSVAVVGASVKEGSLGRQMMVELLRGGFDGRIYPVNPGYDEVLGVPCLPSIADVPEPVDLAILGVANARIEAAPADAGEAGAASAVTFSSLYEEAPSSPGMPPLAARLAAIARDRGMAFCGGNGMGFVNVPGRLRATGFPTPNDVREGPVTFISHSGSAFAALMFSDRGLGFDLLISSGQEIVTTMDEYIGFALERGTTRVVALLLETVREPPGFRAALAAAAEGEVPVIALVVGRTEGSKAMVTAHSGALAGEHGAYEALFDAYGVHEVRTLDEMADTIELFSCPRRVRSGRGIASIHDSGGERALFVDLASDLGVPFARISDETRTAIQDTLDPGLEAANPLDAWGTGIDADRIFRESFLALAKDTDTAAMAFVVDLTRQGEPYDEGYLRVARDVWEGTDGPFCVLSNLASAVAHEEAAVLREAGIPVLEGTESGLRALRHLLDEREVRERAHMAPLEAVPDEVRERWRTRLASGEPFDEAEAIAMLWDYGVPAVRATTVTSADQAVAAAEGIWPVALKTAAPGVQHKSDVGGVRLHIYDPERLRAEYEEIARRLGPRMTVSAMAYSEDESEGVEMALGIVRDPMFGPLVLVAAGGVLVELLHDRRLALPPVDAAGARRMIDGLRSRPLLDGLRGAPAADVEALAEAVARLSALATDLGDLLDAVDVNPVIVGPDGCVAVDALVIPRSGD
jgi:acyl-CoA synthetase (NDP forming)